MLVRCSAKHSLSRQLFKIRIALLRQLTKIRLQPSFYLRAMLGYLCRLKKRMEKRQFPHDDKLLRAVVSGYDAMHALNVEVHYLSCESGVGREPPNVE